MTWQWKFLADIRGTPGDVSLYGPAWAPTRNVPASADLNTFKTPGWHRISTPDTATILNMPPGTRVASMFGNITTGTGTDVITGQRVLETGDSARNLWRPAFTDGSGYGPWSLEGVAARPVTEWHVFLAVGQSNMSGRGIVSAAAGGKYMQTRIAQFGFTRRVVETAPVPLDMHDASPSNGLSPASVFANNYLRTQPANVGALIVTAAHGGTGFTTSTTTNTWTPGAATNPVYDLPKIAVDQTKDAITAAKAGGAAVTLKGILWHQGENNTSMSQASYASNLDTLIAYFRAQLGDSKLPFIVGQMVPEGIEANAGRPNIDAAHQDTPNRVPYTGFAAARRSSYNFEDATPVHFNRDGVDFLGRTYLEAYEQVKVGSPALAAVPGAVQTYINTDPTVIQAAADLAANNAGLIAKWKPNTAYTAGQQVVTPDGDIVTRTTSGTSGASYTATNWTPSATTQGLGAKLDATQKGAANGVAPLGADSKVPAANLRNPIVRGDDGKEYRVIACVLRNNGAPNYWQVIDDGAHVPIGVSSVTSDATQITLNYNFTATAAGTVIVQTDETMAALGFHCGPSVSVNKCDIKLSRKRVINAYVYWDGAAWQASPGGNFTVSSFTGGVLALTHEMMLGTSVTVAGRGIAARPVVSDGAGAITGTATLLKFYDAAGTLLTTPTTDMKVYVTRTDAVGTANPQTVIDTTSQPLHNLWVYGFHPIN